MQYPVKPRLVVSALCFVCLAACGGGGGGGGGAAPVPPPASQTDFEQGIFRDASLFKNICLNPRVGNFPDTQGDAIDENEWLRAWSHELYLWYDEIIDEDPRSYATLDYFDLMKTFATTPSGADRDQFHFTFDTEVWQQLSQSGVAAGYGAEFELVASVPPRRIVVAFVEPGSPAADPASDLRRGTVIVEVDGANVENGNAATLNAGLFPDAAGEVHQFVVEDFNGANRRTVTMTAAEINQDPVQAVSVFDTAAGPVGYMAFHAHIATSEAELVDAIELFATAGIVELVIDLRYNGGGFLDIANELAFMIAGPSAASGRVFAETRFNAKHPSINPVTGASLMPDTFHSTTQGFSLPSGSPLPSVNLARVFVLSGPGACSASEAIINGLRGIDVEVVLIGETTCGKPYGFYPTDNCGTTYFSTQFRSVNARGFGDYADGFVPVAGALADDEVEGCVVADDFSKPLGDATEARLATALDYMSSGTCNPPPVATASTQTTKSVRIGAGDPSQKLNNPRRMPGAILR